MGKYFFPNFHFFLLLLLDYYFFHFSEMICVSNKDKNRIFVKMVGLLVVLGRIQKYFAEGLNRPFLKEEKYRFI